MRRKWVIALASLVLLMPAAPSEASQVTPMIVELTPNGQQAIARVQLTNDADSDIPYEVEMMRGEISPDGKLSLTPADDEFLVFPAQAAVKANSQQVFRIQYVGQQDLKQSEIFYMSIRQVPVSLTPAQAQIQFVVNFNVLVNVVPDGATPDPAIKSIEPGEKDGKPGLNVDVVNNGSKYFLAGFSQWTLTGKTADGKNFSTVLKGDDLTKAVGVGVVTPGHERIFFVPTEQKLAPNSAAVTIKP